MTKEMTNHTAEQIRAQVALIIGLVAQAHGLTAEGLLQTIRTNAISIPRQAAMLIARQLTGASYPDLAEAFKRKNHMTIIWGCDATLERITSDADFARSFAATKARCEALTSQMPKRRAHR